MEGELHKETISGIYSFVVPESLNHRDETHNMIHGILAFL